VGGPGRQQLVRSSLTLFRWGRAARRFWLSTIKVLTLTGLILLALIIDLGGVPGQERIGFRYWQDGKAFKPYKTTGDVGKFLGFVNALVLALFAYMGTELIGVTVGEAKVRRGRCSVEVSSGLAECGRFLRRTRARRFLLPSKRPFSVSSSSTSCVPVVPPLSRSGHGVYPCVHTPAPPADRCPPRRHGRRF
jgi:hypothetical protein